MASVCMCENAPGPVSMLMSSSRWERGGWTNNEQTHQQPVNLKGQTDPPVWCVSTQTLRDIRVVLLVSWSVQTLNIELSYAHVATG